MEPFHVARFRDSATARFACFHNAASLNDAQMPNERMRNCQQSVSNCRSNVELIEGTDRHNKRLKSFIAISNSNDENLGRYSEEVEELSGGRN
jgi:hypothetical protein